MQSPVPLSTTSDRATAERLVLVITLLLIFLMAARTPLDTDLWWHLRAGEETLRSGQPLLTDVFSFTRAGAQWINHSWLSQVGMALLFRWGGYLALGAAMALLATLSMGLVLAQCEGPAFLKAGALLLGGVVASVVWVPRPQITTLVMLALVAWLVFRYRRKGKNSLWALPLVFVLWSNLHGGYFLGLLLLAAVLGGEVLNHLLRQAPERCLPWRDLARLAGWSLLCIFAVLINPNGLNTWLIPFQTISVGALQQFIPEWASPDFHDALQASMLVLLLATFAAAALAGEVMDGGDLLAVLGFGAMALVARRNFGPFALVAVPALTHSVDHLLQRVGPALTAHRAKPNQRDLPPRLKQGINLGLVALLGLAGIVKLYVVSQPAFVDSYLRQSNPAAAADWLAAQPSGRLFSEYNWGGYLIWRLPADPVFVDGRTDLFGDEIIGAWMRAVQAEPGWQATLDDYAVDYVLLAPHQPLLNALQSTPGWRLAYQDDQAVIYARK